MNDKSEKHSRRIENHQIFQKDGKSKNLPEGQKIGNLLAKFPERKNVQDDWKLNIMIENILNIYSVLL